jgi:DNA polymerase-3 subunit delta'
LKKCKSLRDLEAGPEFRERLRRQVLESFPQSLILHGPEGIGKESWGRAIGAYYLCLEPQADDACGKCQACHYFAEGTHPDWIEILPEASGKTIPLDTVREQVHRSLWTKPQIGDRRVWLIDADALLESAQNALLKVLEEPPSYAKFILLVEDRAKLLPTLLSRSVSLELPRLDNAAMARVLSKEDGQVGREDFATALASGIAGKAIEIYTDQDFWQLREQVCRWFFAFPAKAPSSVLSSDFDFFKDLKDDWPRVLTLLQNLVRDCLLAQEGLDERMLQQDLADSIRKFNSHYSLGRDGWANLSRYLEDLETRLRANANYELQVCRTLLLMRGEFDSCRQE